MRRPHLSAFNVLLMLLGAFLLFLAISDAGPVIRAARAGGGIPGTFTARQLSCVRHPGHESCRWQGEFRSQNGRVTRPSVRLHGGAGDLAPGAVTGARDIGRPAEVYRPAGTREWVPTTLLALTGLVLLVLGATRRDSTVAARETP